MGLGVRNTTTDCGPTENSLGRNSQNSYLMASNRSISNGTIGAGDWTPQFHYWLRPDQLEDGGENVRD